MRISRRKILLFAGSGVLGGAAAAAAGAVTFVAVGEARYANRFYPGVRVDGEDVGGLTLAQARDRLQARWDGFGAAPVVFRLDGRTWNPRGLEVGIQVNYDTPLAQAYAWGRRGGWEARLPPAAPDPGSAARLADHGQFRSARVHGLCRAHCRRDRADAHGRLAADRKPGRPAPRQGVSVARRSRAGTG